MCAWREDEGSVCRECGEHALYIFICLLLCLLTLPLFPCAFTCLLLSLLSFLLIWVSGIIFGLFITSFVVVQWGFSWPITTSHAQANLRKPHIPTLCLSSLSLDPNSSSLFYQITLPRLFTKMFYFYIWLDEFIFSDQT